MSYGKKTTLYGIATDDKVEYSWEDPGLPAGFDEWAQGEINKVFTPIGVEPGKHEYTFYTRRIGEGSCSNSFTMAVKL